ncbi:MAG: 6-carboxytetrahydropterin synthase [Planctomycetaceae bacterium]|nr:6-carboxytetrahydropterin synthase [Planctomycetaceae bacterium]
MFTITVSTVFVAGHQLKFTAGAESYHIHDWQAEAAVAGEHLDQNGLLLDFNDLKKTIDEIVSPFSDRALEDFDCFKDMNTSAENVAKYIYDSIKKQLQQGVKLLYVEVTEAPGCKAKYSEKQV